MADASGCPARTESPKLRVLTQAEACFAGLADADADQLNAFRAVISTYPDRGATGDGEVVASLFMLLGRFMASGRVDRDALSVHLRAWRLLLSSDPDARARERLMAGLRAVLRRYADAEAA